MTLSLNSTNFSFQNLDDSLIYHYLEDEKLLLQCQARSCKCNCIPHNPGIEFLKCSISSLLCSWRGRKIQICKMFHKIMLETSNNKQIGRSDKFLACLTFQASIKKELEFISMNLYMSEWTVSITYLSSYSLCSIKRFSGTFSQ